MFAPHSRPLFCRILRCIWQDKAAALQAHPAWGYATNGYRATTKYDPTLLTRTVSLCQRFGKENLPKTVCDGILIYQFIRVPVISMYTFA